MTYGLISVHVGCQSQQGKVQDLLNVAQSCGPIMTYTTDPHVSTHPQTCEGLVLSEKHKKNPLNALFKPVQRSRIHTGNLPTSKIRIFDRLCGGHHHSGFTSICSFSPSQAASSSLGLKKQAELFQHLLARSYEAY